MALNDARIRALKPGSRDRWVGDGKGLWLRVRTSGSKVFVVRSKRGGRVKVITLGEWPDVSLARARREAAKVAADRPGRTLRTDLEPVTVKQLAEEYFARRIGPRYRRSANARTYRDKLIETLGWRRADELHARDVAEVVKAYARSAPVASNRFLSYAKATFAYGMASGYLETNPAAPLTRDVAGGEEVPRERILSDDELRQVWQAPGAHTRLLRFLLLTGARIGEAQRATWAHFDLQAQRWTIPAQHAKNGRAHWVHLPELACSVLGLPGASAALALRSSSETAVQAWLHRWCDREGITPRFTPHDLRRTFATRLGDLGVAPHVIAACLNHTLQTSSSLGVYLRSDFESERVEALEQWAAALQRIAEVRHA